MDFLGAKRAGPTGVYIAGSVDVRVVDIRVGGLYRARNMGGGAADEATDVGTSSWLSKTCRSIFRSSVTYLDATNSSNRRSRPSNPDTGEINSPVKKRTRKWRSRKTFLNAVSTIVVRIRDSIWTRQK